MSVDFLEEVYEENLVKNNMDCINLLAKASLKMSKKLDSEIRSNEFVLIGGEDAEQDCVVYNVNTKQARQLPHLQKQRCLATAVKVGKKVYVVGGAVHAEPKSSHKSGEVLELNEQMEWVAIPDMQEARSNCKGGLIQNFIYVTGGYNSKLLSSCERFDTYNKKWSSISDMLHARTAHGTVVYNGSLYSIGGWDGRNRSSSCERYDVRSDVWSEIAPLNQARNGLACVVLDGNIYAIGNSCRFHI
uniref:Kelch-like protein 12 n=1 Tax=Phallusia mammillata TaxID=59560 RepID=A0A6F9DFE3_9ASCI|nr:kelch-like protein 12 [Phallusia mammillata]